MDAQQVFDKLLKRDVVSWNSSFGGYAKAAFTLFCQMPREGFDKNKTTYTNIVKAEWAPPLSTCMQMFDKMVKRTVTTWISLIEGYAQQGHCESFEVSRQCNELA